MEHTFLPPFSTVQHQHTIAAASDDNLHQSKDLKRQYIKSKILKQGMEAFPFLEAVTYYTFSGDGGG